MVRAGACVIAGVLALAGCERSSTVEPQSSSRPGAALPAPRSAASSTQELPVDPNAKVNLTDEQWRQRLTAEQFAILRKKGTERAFTGKYWDTTTPGAYTCAGCGLVLFTSDTKFDSHCGWPSFYDKANPGAIEEHRDTSFGMVRTEVTCARCGGHLGHVFDDGPADKTGLRYCINSASIDLKPASDTPPTP
ncbi:MAG TPA: peptide-methionine (R)-S-oxide reductase [Phycisphaerales bacterium]|nr:peptide-methionine (R)-S-oxide reductase [Phycisphaerales bacterium]